MYEKKQSGPNRSLSTTSIGSNERLWRKTLWGMAATVQSTLYAQVNILLNPTWNDVIPKQKAQENEIICHSLNVHWKRRLQGLELKLPVVTKYPVQITITLSSAQKCHASFLKRHILCTAMKAECLCLKEQTAMAVTVALVLWKGNVSAMHLRAEHLHKIWTWAMVNCHIITAYFALAVETMDTSQIALWSQFL